MKVRSWLSVPSFPIVVALVLSITHLSCGGGTLGTGLGKPGVGPQRYGGTTGTGIKTGVSYFTITGVISALDGRPLDGVTVQVETPRTQESTVTDHLGRYTAYVVKADKEPLHFHFTYDESQSTYLLPEIKFATKSSSGKVATQNFVFEPKGFFRPK